MNHTRLALGSMLAIISAIGMIDKIRKRNSSAAIWACNTLIVALGATLGGCATVFQNPTHCVERGDGLCWYPNPVQIPVTKVRWEVDSSLNASRRCGFGFHFHNAACVMGRLRETGECWVVSALTEQQARALLVPSPVAHRAKSVWRHEVEDHCGIHADPSAPQGVRLETQWVHSDRTVWSLTAPR